MSTIFIEKRTRDKLRNIGRKDQTYDDIINELIQVSELLTEGSSDTSQLSKEEKM
jgi:uncharacterized protein YggL (DUF469 family)